MFVQVRMSLAELIQASAPLPWNQAVVILQQLATALDDAHKRDRIAGNLCPETIFLAENDEIYIGALQNVSVPERDSVTLPYLAPERLRGMPATASSDQFSLAVIFYEMITGKRPFESEDEEWLRHLIRAESPALLPQGVSAPIGVYSVLSRALAKSPDDRYEDVLAFLWAIEALSLDDPSMHPRRRLRGYILAALALILAMGLAFLIVPRSALVTAMLFPSPTPTAKATVAEIIIPTATSTFTATSTPDITPTVIVESTAEGGGVTAFSQAAPTLTATPTLQRTPTPIPTPTSTPVPLAKVNRNINLRRGPSVTHPVAGKAKSGQLLPILGKTTDGTWLQVESPAGVVWVAAKLVDIQNVSSILLKTKITLLNSFLSNLKFFLIFPTIIC